MGGLRPVAAVRSILQGKFYYGWVIVVLAFFGDLMSAGTGGYTLGLYFRPMREELGWDRTTITFALTISRVVSGLSSPAIGWALDHWGGRIVMTSGAILGAVGLASIAIVQEPWHFYLLYGVIGALGIAEFGNLASSAALAKWFVRMRGRAMAFATMGVSAGGVVLIPVTNFMIEQAGWRMSWVLIGLLILVLVTIPTALFMRSRPEDLGLLPDGDAPADPATAAGGQRGTASVPSARTEISWTLKEALRAPAFWLLIPAFNFSGMALSVVLLHQIPYMEEKGVSIGDAAWIGALMAFFAMICKPGWGLLLERIHVRYCVMLSFAGSIVGLALLRFANADDPSLLYLYAVVYGMTMGAMPVLNSVTWANYFGRTFIGTIRGVTMPLNIVFSAGAPLLAAWIADTYHSYDVAMYIFMGTYGLGLFFIFLARQPVHPSRKAEAAAVA